jgi:histidyl-tRNA synthetase
VAKAVVTQPPKGTRDLLPLDVRRRDHVIGVIREVYEAHGFEPLQTPALERLDTLLGKYGEEGDQLLFKVLLRGEPLVEGLRAAGAHLQQPGALVQGRSGETAPGAEPLLADLGLRYDLTVPLARVYAAYQGKLPPLFKRYQIQPVWRADTPGKGRFREFYQCDVDVVGSTSALVEAEVAGAAAECLQRLGFDDCVLRINHRGLLRALIERAGLAAAQEVDAITAIDKLDKVGLDGVARELETRGVDATGREALLGLLAHGNDLDALATALGDHAAGAQAVAELRQVLELASVTPAHGKLRFDVTLARGLSYYTGCIFEANVKDLAGSIGGGGRYDGLIGMFLGKQVPACGFSLGLERILVVMAERGMFPASLNEPHAVLGLLDEADAKAALRLARQLRDAGLRVDLRPKAIKPGKLRQEIEQRGLGHAIWLEPGATERASLWRRGEEKVQTNLPFGAIASAIGAEPPKATVAP